MNDNLFNAILEYGNRYRKEYIFEKYTKELLLEDWREALWFFFSRVCYQGRRDTVSEKVYQSVVDILKPKLSRDGNVSELDLVKIRKELETRIGPKGKEEVTEQKKHGKGRDIDMVISTLKYVGRIPQPNIVTYSIEFIKASGVDNLYNHLRNKANDLGITQVGEKVASFYLRDLVTLFQLEDQIAPSSLYCLQPIDTWVNKLAKKIDIVGNNASDSKIRQAIVELCNEKNASSIQFNQGAWYAGSHAYDLLLENIAKYGI